MKLYTNGPFHQLTWLSQMVAEFTQQKDFELVIVSPEMNDSAEFKAKRAHGKFPMLELDDGSMVYESLAIAQYMARRSASHGPALLGRCAMEQAMVNQWVNWGMMNIAWPCAKVFYNTLGVMNSSDDYAAGLKTVKEMLKVLNTHLEGKTFMVANRLTMADLVIANMLIGPFAFALDPGFRKAHSNVSDWWARVTSQSCFMSVAGRVKMCEKAIKPVDVSKLPKYEAPEKKAIEEVVKAEPKKAADEEDDFDPFADEEEDPEAEKAKMERMREIAKTAKSYGKEKPVAKSLIIFEVKPWGEDTDLDEMAKLIIDIEMDGLFWKTEYKKEPIAYGVFKVVIGATVEDEKVSTDELQEKIEALEDHVQSVDIAAFNKL